MQSSPFLSCAQQEIMAWVMCVHACGVEVERCNSGENGVFHEIDRIQR
jgi:hypothetical protein